MSCIKCGWRRIIELFSCLPQELLHGKNLYFYFLFFLLRLYLIEKTEGLCITTLRLNWNVWFFRRKRSGFSRCHNPVIPLHGSANVLPIKGITDSIRKCNLWKLTFKKGLPVTKWGNVQRGRKLCGHDLQLGRRRRLVVVFHGFCTS